MFARFQLNRPQNLGIVGNISHKFGVQATVRPIMQFGGHLLFFAILTFPINSSTLMVINFELIVGRTCLQSAKELMASVYLHACNSLYAAL